MKNMAKKRVVEKFTESAKGGPLSGAGVKKTKKVSSTDKPKITKSK